MAASKVLYTGDGSVKSFNIPFPYISASHLKVFVDNILQLNPMNYTLSGASTILFGSAPGADSAVEIRRHTSPNSILVDFQDGSVLSESDLDTAYLHNYYLAQEYADSFNEILNNVLLKIAGNLGIVETETDLIIAALVNEMLLDANVANLQARIADIDANAEAIITVGEGIQTQINTLAQGIAATVYIQASEPIPGQGGIPDPIPDGARWYDSDDNNHPYIYQNDAWADLEDPRIGVNAADITVLEVDMVDAEGDIIANAGIVVVLDTTVTANETANATAHTTLTANVATNVASITTEATARSDADTALAAVTAALVVTMGTDIAAAVLTETTARITADAVLAAVTTALVVTMGTDIAAAVLTETTARITDVDAETTAREAQYVTVGNDIAAAVLTETNARVTAVSAEATARVALGVTLSSEMNAAVLVETNVRITEDAVVAATVTALTSQMATDIAAAVLTETTARTTADTALAATTTTLQSEVDDNLATIVTHATSIDGIETEYGVDLTVNGYIQGFRIINGGTPGENAFIILADKFAIVDASGDPAETQYVPFEISGGKINIRGDVKIDGNLMVTGTINGSALINGTIGSTQIGADSIYSDAIQADSIIANHINAGEITATEMSMDNLAALFADLGSITAGNITLDTSGYIKGGQTAYATGDGFFLGYDTADFKFSIGNATNYLTWDGTSLTIRGDLLVGEYVSSANVILSAPTNRSDTGHLGPWVTYKSFRIDKTGTVKLAFDAKVDTNDDIINYAQYQVLKNSTQIAQSNVSNTGFQEKTVTVSGLVENDEIHIQLKGGNSVPAEPFPFSIYIENVEIRADVVISPGGTVLLD